ncbi:hypothetical protein FNF27_06754 [Cafeteria roenbergensis]|uniref:Uncharacterized protein n=2 Tax=Cafeteria roenbergensis TaxID=33653 RepID=A0A5A8CPB5_CAFRO|nr:hypothetical protein FNF29_02989 [Cafeteria roenbergensis]KAA0170001.1 hypothetical protein FNF27_06754 [Cafeteria roenbergensis]|eukprot:KAA0153601.1 hypothetical protein FNF29_02989 [Cafeteria roenbergensis]
MAFSNRFAALAEDSDDEGGLRFAESGIAAAEAQAEEAKKDNIGHSSTHAMLDALCGIDGAGPSLPATAGRTVGQKWGGMSAHLSASTQATEPGASAGGSDEPDPFAGKGGVLGGMAGALAALKGEGKADSPATAAPAGQPAREAAGRGMANPFLSTGGARRRGAASDKAGAASITMGTVEAAMLAADADEPARWNFGELLDEAAKETDKAEAALQEQLLKRLEAAHDADVETRGVAAAQRRLKAKGANRKLNKEAGLKEFERLSALGARRGVRENNRQKRARARRVLKNLY